MITCEQRRGYERISHTEIAHRAQIEIVSRSRRDRVEIALRSRRAHMLLSSAEIERGGLTCSRMTWQLHGPFIVGALITQFVISAGTVVAETKPMLFMRPHLSATAV